MCFYEYKSSMQRQKSFSSCMSSVRHRSCTEALTLEPTGVYTGPRTPRFNCANRPVTTNLANGLIACVGCVTFESFVVLAMTCIDADIRSASLTGTVPSLVIVIIYYLRPTRLCLPGVCLSFCLFVCLLAMLLKNY